MIMSSFHILFYLMVLIIIVCNIGLHSGPSNREYSNLAPGNTNETATTTMKIEQPYLNHRKLLQYGRCTNRDLSISQSRGPSSGIPQFTVQIVNTCVSGCSPSNIHLHCGWFASARIVNPRTFKRLSYDDCLVNGGMPLKTGQIIRFTYSNSFMYPITFKSAKFC